MLPDRRVPQVLPELVPLEQSVPQVLLAQSVLQVLLAQSVQQVLPELVLLE